MNIKKPFIDINMKNILYFFIISIWSTFVAAAQTSSATLTLGCPATAVTAGNDFLVNSTITSSHYTGNVTVLLNFDNTKVIFIGIPTTYAVTNNGITTSGTTSTLSVTVPITGTTGGQNQGSFFAVKFRTICPQTCFGSSLTANFTGSISAPTIPSVAALPCSTSISVLNNWVGTHSRASGVFYNCITNRVTFNIMIYGSSCHELRNAKVTITPSIPGATLVPNSSGNISGNTITLPPVISHISGYSFNYEIQLPCTATYPTVLNVDAVLGGDNCGNYNPNILTTPLPSAQFTMPNVSNTAINTWSYANATTAFVHFPNGGSTPMNLTNTTVFPAVRVTSASLTLPAGATASMTFFDCSNNPITTVTTFPYTLTALATKATYTISNLPPGQTASLAFNYVTTSACTSPPVTTGIIFETTGSYTGFLDPSTSYCNCIIGTGNIGVIGVYTPPVVPPPATNIVCLGVGQSNSGCKKAGDVVNYCLNFRNLGNKDLATPVLKIPVTPNLTFDLTSLRYNGTPVTGSIVSGELVIALPGIIPFAGYPVQMLCFDATVNAVAPEGVFYSQPYSISGTDYTMKILNCAYNLTVCSDPKAIVVKEVYDTENSVWGSSGSGLAGVPTRYRITIKNIGNVQMTNVVFLDRTPEPGDNFVLSQNATCDPRNSQYKMMPTGVFTPTQVATYENSAVGTNKIPTSFVSSNLTSCDITSTGFSSTTANTVRIDIPIMIPPFSDYTFEMGVDVPASAKASERACNTASISYSYKMQDGAVGYGGVLESDSVCYTVLPPPCNNCPGLAGTSSFALTAGIVSSAAKPYVTKSGTVTITTLKPVQEVRISIADLQYSWNKAGCTDCKLPAIARGGLFPVAIPQNVGTGGANGYLDFYDFTGNGNPATVTPDNCPEELIWKLGVMLQPGTYTIPIQLTLPKPQIEDCCTLELGKFDVKVTLKDAECKVCDFILPPSDENCCTGGKWISKTIAAPPIRIDRMEVAALSRLKTPLSLEEKQQKDAWDFNALIAKDVIRANPIGMVGTPIPVNCESSEPVRLAEGATRIFAAQYACHASMKDCNGTVLISIRGNGVNIFNQPSPVSQTFTQPGEYSITYTATCGGKPCGEPCRFKVLVEKNCCAGSAWNTRTYQVINKYPTAAGPVTQIPDFVAGAIPAVATSMAVRVNLGYNCATSCTPSYLIRTITAGVSQDVTLTGATTNYVIYPNPTTPKRVVIYGMCGGKTCGGLPLIFDVVCNGTCVEVSPNSIQVYPVGEGMLDGRKALLNDKELQQLLQPLASQGSTYQLAQIEKQNGQTVLVAQYAGEQSGSVETVTIPLATENGYLKLSGIPTRTNVTKGKTTTTQLPVVTSKKHDYVGHVTLLK